MKKTLFFIAWICFVFASFAQNNNSNSIAKIDLKSKSILKHLDVNVSEESNGIFNSIVFGERGILEPTRTKVASSFNIFGAINLDQTFVTYNDKANIILFGNRAGGEFGGTGNDLIIAYSTDSGATYKNFIVKCRDNNSRFRYPSFAIYNPEGNTDPNNAYIIYTGPYTGGGGWLGNYFGSVKLGDTTNSHTTYIPFDNIGGTTLFNQKNIGTYAFADGYTIVASKRINGTLDNYTSIGWEVNTGQFNADSNYVVWNKTPIYVNTNLSEKNRLDAEAMVFSSDGKTGYLIGTGVDSDIAYNPYGADWPVIYVTKDTGKTWDKAPAFDFSNTENILENLLPLQNNLNKAIPKFYNKWISFNNENSNGYAVDKNGNLHIIAYLQSTVGLGDSLNKYYYPKETKKIYDLHMTGPSSWKILLIDSIKTKAYNKYVDVTSSPADTFKLDHRIQASRSADGKYIYGVYCDTRFEGGDDINKFPDIFTWEYNVETEEIAGPVNETGSSDNLGGECEWMHASNIAYTLSSGLRTIPVSYSKGGTTVDDAMIHYMVSGLNIQPTGINEIVADNKNIIVSANYPNPFSGETFINVNVDKNTNVSIEVFNLVGQKVISVPTKVLSPGETILSIDANKLNSGVYTYIVTAGANKFAGKMIVQ